MDSAVQSFVQEAREILEELEAMLLSLEGEDDTETVDAVFRALHTVKGSGSMFGFTILADFTHHFETAFDMVRERKLSVTQELIDNALRARDHMMALLQTGGDTDAARELASGPNAREIVTAMVALTGQAGKAGGTPAEKAGASDAAAGTSARRYSITFTPAPDSLRNGMRPDLLIEELCGLGTARTTLDVSAVPPLDQIEPSNSYLTWHVELETTAPRAEIEAVFVFADDAKLQIEELARDTPISSSQASGGKQSRGGSDNVRVSSDRLDDMMDRLGELVIAHSRLDQIALPFDDPTLDGVVEEMERLITGLRDVTLSIRMLPIETVFGKFRRVVRDLSRELEKDVELVVSGGETEIDKNVIDRLNEPLVHMIRNSMDHGIEPEAERLAAGKPGRGHVHLAASQEGGEVLISIQDDGRGLNLEKIRARAVERGLVAENAELSDQELRQLIFLPGFSTAQELTSVSGRGVGMDAVRSVIDALNGSVEVWSERGQGMRACLRIPMTLAIIDGLLVQLGSTIFVIPLANVEECVELDSVERRRESGRTMLEIRESLVPFLDLIDVFDMPPSEKPRRRVVIIRSEGNRLGLVVDDILGQNQTVIKPLSLFHRDVAGFAGATILGDGAVALIIDVPTLARTAVARGLAQEALAHTHASVSERRAS